MKYYKIVCGFNEEENISINENELAKAISLFMSAKGRALFENGAIRGQDIKRVVPDWHKVMGWNRSWKITPDEYSDIKHLEKGYNETYNQASLLAELATKTNRLELLLKPFSEAVLFLPEQNKEISEGSKLLASKMKM